MSIRLPLCWLAVACVSLVVCDAGAKPTGRRRAVLVGINDYTASGLTARPRGVPPPSRDWPNLSGAVNDVEAMKEMLVRLYDFQERDIVTLTDQFATRSKILEAVGQHLAKPAARGDVLLFYFAGHGSQVQNSLSDEADKLDESLVAADSRLGVLDIRDKELRPLFNRILNRGARLSVILDNCHSGSGARGLSTGRRPRGVNPDLRDIADRTNYGPRPEDRGALVLSATQDTDAAWETRDDEKKMHGAFSWAWIRAMRDSSAGESVAETFARATARLRAERAYQEPVIAGTSEMTRSPFLGARVDRRGDRTVIAVERVRSAGTIFLQGGWANGLEVGCELRVIDHFASVRVTITAMRGLGRSEGRIPDGSQMPQAIRSGALLEVVRWVGPGGRPLRVWMPRISEGIDAIAALARKLAAEASRRGVRWIKDPLSITPSHLIRRGTRQWELLDRDGDVQYLGPDSTDAIAAVARIPATSSLFVQLPAPAALIDAIDVGPGPNCDDREGIDPTDRPEDADYILVGRYANRRLAYAWVRPTTTRPWAEASDERKIGMPLHSEWIVHAHRDDTHRHIAPMLREAVLRLRKIHSWQRLESPLEGRFAYQLDIRRERDGQWAKDGAVIGDEKYALFLRAAKPVARVPPRYIYVFSIDSHGRSVLLFGTSSVENRFPRPPLPGETEPPSEISLGPTATFHAASAYGVDTFFLLTTDEPLPNPRILEWEGVRKGKPKPNPSLEELLIETATGSRTGGRVTPSTWSIERVRYEAVPPRESKTSR